MIIIRHPVKDLKPILRSIFGEMTVLGFIGLIMFIVTKSGKAPLDRLVYECSLGPRLGLDTEAVERLERVEAYVAAQLVHETQFYEAVKVLHREQVEAAGAARFASALAQTTAACERDDVSFERVAAVERALPPRRSRPRRSSGRPRSPIPHCSRLSYST